MNACTPASLRDRSASAAEAPARLLAAMVLLAPALGVPSERMLQDTFKSMVVCGCALAAALLFFWHQRQRPQPLLWHRVVWLPLWLLLYALGSMLWSHTYLAGVEAMRWGIFALIVWLGLNTLTRERLPRLAWGLHAGALVASVWTALQFWFDLSLFPQGPNPASTFVNRNFFAEFLVCTLPVSVGLWVQARTRLRVGLLAFSLALQLVALLMTGTRSALLALGVLALVLPLVLWRYRRVLALRHWSANRRWLAVGVLGICILGLGLIPTGNARLIEEHRAEGRGLTAWERSLVRAQSLTQSAEYTERSFSVRWLMWTATARMIADRPLTGVGAGAWEVDIPLYQHEGAQLETDYYAHNEPLQLVAEYGLAGWAFLLGLLAYLLRAAWHTWRLRGAAARAEGLPRALALSGLLALLIVSNAGFPWRMATTGALFALLLAVLAASDARLPPAAGLARQMPARPASTAVGLSLSLVGLLLAGAVAWRAAAAEYHLMGAYRMALSIGHSGRPNDPLQVPRQQALLALVREGIALNPHYRKITPLVADQLARWGDWHNAVWIWESVLQSRPHVVAIITNVARGHMQMGQPRTAQAWLERARRLQPMAPAVRSLAVMLLTRQGQVEQALQIVREDLAAGRFDNDLVNTGYVLAMRERDWALARRTMALRAQRWPLTQADSAFKTGHAWLGEGDEAQALRHFQAALSALPSEQHPPMLDTLTPALRLRLQAMPAAPSAR